VRNHRSFASGGCGADDFQSTDKLESIGIHDFATKLDGKPDGMLGPA
jgi:hypothetical protein